MSQLCSCCSLLNLPTVTYVLMLKGPNLHGIVSSEIYVSPVTISSQISPNRQFTVLLMPPSLLLWFLPADIKDLLDSLTGSEVVYRVGHGCLQCKHTHTQTNTLSLWLWVNGSENERVDSDSAPVCYSPAAVMFSSRRCLPHVLDWHFKEFTWLCIREGGKASDVEVRVERDSRDVASQFNETVDWKQYVSYLFVVFRLTMRYVHFELIHYWIRQFSGCSHQTVCEDQTYW